MARKLVPATSQSRQIEQVIKVIRGHRVMLDSDLAHLYEVSTAALNQAVKRNSSRFPQDFAFQLTQQEFGDLISQSVTSNVGRGGRGNFLGFSPNTA